MLAYAGLRPGETLALGWADIGKRATDHEFDLQPRREEHQDGGARSVRFLEPMADDLTAWRAATTRPGGLVFPRPGGSPLRRDDWTNWRHRTFQANAEQIGGLHARPYD